MASKAARRTHAWFELCSQAPSVIDLARRVEIQGAFKTVAAPAELQEHLASRRGPAEIDDQGVNLKAALPSLETADHVCHELRKPMAVIHAYAELLADEIAGPLNEKQKGYVEIVLQSVQRLELMISDLFETSGVVSWAENRPDQPTTFAPELPLGESRASGEGGADDHGIDDNPRA